MVRGGRARRCLGGQNCVTLGKPLGPEAVLARRRNRAARRRPHRSWRFTRTRHRGSERARCACGRPGARPASPRFAWRSRLRPLLQPGPARNAGDGEAPAAGGEDTPHAAPPATAHRHGQPRALPTRRHRRRRLCGPTPWRCARGRGRSASGTAAPAADSRKALFRRIPRTAADRAGPAPVRHRRRVPARGLLRADSPPAGPASAARSAAQIARGPARPVTAPGLDR